MDMKAPYVLIVGCGNASRRDDGVGLYVIRGIAERLHLADVGAEDEARLEGMVASAAGALRVELRFEQQLDIVLADELGAVDLFIVVDAHTGAYPETLRRVELEPGYESSITSHHLTPETLAGLSQALHQRAPRTIVYSIRGFDFNFGEELTPQTQEAADQAIAEIVALVNEGKI